VPWSAARRLTSRRGGNGTVARWDVGATPSGPSSAAPRPRPAAVAAGLVREEGSAGLVLSSGVRRYCQCSGRARRSACPRCTNARSTVPAAFSETPAMPARSRGDLPTGAERDPHAPLSLRVEDRAVRALAGFHRQDATVSCRQTATTARLRSPHVSDRSGRGGGLSSTRSATSWRPELTSVSIDRRRSETASGPRSL
jgi:hypothetical protein